MGPSAPLEPSVTNAKKENEYVFSDHQLWNKPDTSSQGPNPELRMGHTATYDPTMRCIYVFGGSKNLKWFNDIHVLDIDEWKWELVKVSFISYLFLLNMEMRHLNLHPRSITLKLTQQSSNHGYAILCGVPT